MKRLIVLFLVNLFLIQALYSAYDLDGLDNFDEMAEFPEKIEAPTTKEESKSLFSKWKEKLPSWNKLSKEEKVLVVNVAGISLITVYGLLTWDYGTSDNLRFKNEGWFGDETKSAGTDKLGHLFSTYIISDILSYYYRKWGYDTKKASLYAGISSWILTALMEVGDSSSARHGFSYEDVVMNTLGAVASYIFNTNPFLDRLIDLRLKYDNLPRDDFTTDYNNMGFLAAFKLEALSPFQRNFLKYFEIHVGYYARGYKGVSANERTDERFRKMYVGVGVNLASLLKKADTKRGLLTKASKITEYLQLPFTSVNTEVHNFND